MTVRLPFTQLAVRRAIKAARLEGLRVTGIAKDGTVLVEDGDKEWARGASPSGGSSHDPAIITGYEDAET